MGAVSGRALTRRGRAQYGAVAPSKPFRPRGVVAPYTHRQYRRLMRSTVNALDG